MNPSRRKRPIKLVHVVLAVPVDSETYMDILSDARDDSEGELIEWAVLKRNGKLVSSRVVDGDSPAMLEMFDSEYVSPTLHPASYSRQLSREKTL